MSKQYIIEFEGDAELAPEGTISYKCLQENEIDQAQKLILCMYETKLKELMPADEFTEFIKDIARKLFLQEIENMPEGDFNDYCFQHFEEITKYINSI